ncbi:P-loop NTPase fold protein [Vogesella sp. DC21W]|uniref:P-loop NTPase fold protein n=1 Tax=Vogesella aquatica TaxID=2984206 RepID=A0ABT5ITY1_9NEIS|nr:P-loop NTPase fold protein [Vogesella aquatica]MDC7715638.1 P-loop NTPase fold protein [Vogesella aquatica]
MLLKQQFPDASFVVGIEGEWGEGKSSFINCLKQRFEQAKQVHGEIPPAVVEFNPWWFENPEKTASNLLETIINGRDQNDKEAIKALEALFAALNHITPWLEKLASNPLVLTVLFGANAVAMLANGKDVPWIGALVAAGLSLVLYICTKWLARHRVRSESLAGLKQKAAAALKSEKMKGQKQIVIIDDLDRLSHEEIREVFRAVKGVLDLPNIVYVIAYDRAIVASALDEVHKGKGEAYLEKIVQLQYRLPKPTRKKWQDYNFDTLIKTGLLRHGTPSDEEARFSFDVISQAFLTLPRDAKRLLASVHAYQLIPEEIRIDPFDFLFLEALRLKDRRLWEQLLTAILSVRELILMPRDNKSAEELLATWLQTYIPKLEETKPAIKDAIQHFTGWPVGWNKELKERAVTPQRLSRLVSRVQSHFGYRSWDDEIEVLLNMVRAYRQSQPAENQSSNEEIERFLQAGSVSTLAAALPGQGMKPIFFYESIGYLRHRLGFSFLHVRHASLVAEYLEGRTWEEISLMGYLREFLDCVFAEEAKPYQIIDLSDVAKEMVTDWLVCERAPTIALSVGFSQQGDWSAFRALAVEKCLDMSLEELLAIPDPVVAARVLDAMGEGDSVKRAAWEAALPDRLSEEGQGRLNFLFTGSMDSKKTMIESTWLNESERFKALITPPSSTAS